MKLAGYLYLILSFISQLSNKLEYSTPKIRHTYYQLIALNDNIKVGEYLLRLITIVQVATTHTKESADFIPHKFVIFKTCLRSSFDSEKIDITETSLKKITRFTLQVMMVNQVTKVTKDFLEKLKIRAIKGIRGYQDHEDLVDLQVVSVNPELLVPLERKVM